MTRTPKTDAQYAARFRQLQGQAAKSLGIQTPSSVAPIQVVEHLIYRRPSIAKRTWRQYKAALVAELTRSRDAAPDRAAQHEINHALQILLQEPQTGAMTRGTRTSAKKLRALPNKDFDTLCHYVQSKVGVHAWAAALLVWCRAAHPTGLRPSEWSGASLITLPTGHPALVVTNAKATNGRGNGETRTLDLSGCSVDEIHALEEMLEIAEGFRQDGGYERFQDRLRQYLYKAARAALGRRERYPSLYTFRHQFAANAKRQFNQGEVAALLGHGSDATASRHYAQGRLAQGSLGVKPVTGEVGRVRAKARPRPGGTPVI